MGSENACCATLWSVILEKFEKPVAKLVWVGLLSKNRMPTPTA